HAGEQGVAEPGRPPSRGPAPRLSHLVSWAAAARKRDEHAVKPLRNGTLYAREPNSPHVPESRLPITKLAVDVVVEDQVARVAIDQSFHNPSTMMMEGMYRFAIPPDASLQRLAMYVNGQLMESGVVERMQGRRIYEDIVYRRLDPALLEWAGTGRLALRVYPLPPREDKRLLLAYTQSLPKLYDDWTLSVPLPEVDLPVGELGFDVRVRGCANCEVTSPSHKIDVQRTGEDAVVSYRAKGATLGDSLVLRVRDPRRQATVATHTQGDERFVLVRARPELRAAARTYRPRTWVILDDVSASRGTLELRAQADLIDGFMRELDEKDRVAVVAFDVEARTVLAPTRVEDVDRRALRTQLATEGGIGATSFAAALAAATRLLANVAPEDAMIVYLGDGVITTGKRNLDALRAELAGKAHFIGVGVGDGPDTQTLEALAAATGGYATTIDLADDVGWRAFDLIAALHTARVTNVSARLVDASHLEVPATVYVKTPQLADGEELELVAKLAGGKPPVAVILHGMLDGQAWDQRVELASGSGTAGYLPRLWAQRHIAARLLAKHETISVPPCSGPSAVITASTRRPTAPVTCPTEGELREKRDEAIRKEVVALGKQYFVLSRHTSLLVLEDDAMYAKYNVTKGAGETWAPYKVPAKIPVVPWSASSAPIPSNVADDAELVRSPLRVFYDHGGSFDGDLASAETGLGWGAERGRWRIERGGETLATRDSLGLGPTSGTRLPQAPLAEPGGQGGEAVESEAKRAATELAKEQRQDRDGEAGLLGAITTAQLNGGDDFQAAAQGSGFGRSGAVFASGKRARWAGGGLRAQGGLIYPQRFTYPSDTAYDDLTAFVPALFHDASDRLRAELAAGARAAHPIDDTSRALLAAARAALPAGIYRWNDREIAIDAARRLGWRFTTGADLGETASFDGKTWTRRYAELGLDITRTVTEDDIALALAYIPLWIAEPAHYARWFEVRAAGPREVALWRAPASIAGGGAGRVARRPELAYVLAFDDNHHLVAIRDASGSALVEVTWGAAGPTAARVGGVELDVGFTAQPIADATAWAHGDSKPGIVVELPGRLPAYWAARLA
ncbi:MAG: VWA domain-containing protein, partial [Deltaproteobacteria bacterium]|nr:VWA domain-containing protein [Deltaproteobacteria bacterium]